MNGKIRNQLEKALSFIEQNLATKMTAAEVARYASMSSFHFQRLFIAYLGETVSQYILHRRLEHAALALINQKGLGIIEIAKRSGFENHSAFSRAFKKQFDVSPSVFRKTPDLALTSSDKSRPYLNTVAPKSNEIDVVVEEQPTLWFNYKASEIPEEVESSDFRENVMRIAYDFNGFLDVGKPHLFGVATSRNDGYSTRPKSVDDLFSSFWHGGIYTKKCDDDWSDSWYEIEAGTWAVCTHNGDFEYSYQTWNKFFRSWLPESGYELRDMISFERHLTSPIVVTNSDDWITQIYLPIKKAQTV